MKYEEMIREFETYFESMQKEKQITEYVQLSNKGFTNGFILSIDSNHSVEISTGEVFFVTLNNTFSDGPYFAYEDDEREEVLREVINTVKRLIGGNYIIADRKIFGFTIGLELRFLDKDNQQMTKVIYAKKRKARH